MLDGGNAGSLTGEQNKQTELAEFFFFLSDLVANFGFWWECKKAKLYDCIKWQKKKTQKTLFARI